MSEKEHVRPNQEGTLLGFIGPAWGLTYLIVIAAVVIISVFVIGDPNFS